MISGSDMHAMLIAITADLAGNCHAAAGLQTLIAADVPRGSNVATRKIVASGRAVCCLGGGGGDPALSVEEDEEGGEEEGGCWVMYGRGLPRRLPPLIPSLRGTGRWPWALRRTRTADGRVVVSRVPAPRRGHVSARKVDGHLILELVDGPVPPPPLPHPPIAHETGSPPAAAAVEEEARAEQGSARRDVTDVPAAEQARAPTTSSLVGSSSPSPPLLATGCFEDVIRTDLLRKMHMNLPRMVH